jgi:hypothetical protein
MMSVTVFGCFLRFSVFGGGTGQIIEHRDAWPDNISISLTLKEFNKSKETRCKRFYETKRDLVIAK